MFREVTRDYASPTERDAVCAFAPASTVRQLERKRLGHAPVPNGNLDRLLPEIQSGRLSMRAAAVQLDVNVSTVSRSVAKKLSNRASETLANHEFVGDHASCVKSSFRNE